MLRLALTFDDGPSEENTIELLNVLDKHKVKATFFMIGKFVRKNPDIARLVSRKGHWIGNHTVNHPKLTESTPQNLDFEISHCKEILQDVVGDHSNMFRPPFLMYSAEVGDAVRAHGLRTIWKDASGGDAMQLGANVIVNKVRDELALGSGVILLHDGCHDDDRASRAHTIKAVDILVTKYKSEEVQFISPLEF